MDDYEVLTAARHALDRHRERLDASGLGYNAGRAAEAVIRAEDALFGALNAMTSYMDDKRAESEIRAYYAQREAMVAERLGA